MIVSLDEQFLVHSAVHKAIIRLLRTCAGDELQERIDGRRGNKAMGAASAGSRATPGEYEEDRQYSTRNSSHDLLISIQLSTSSVSFVVVFERIASCSLSSFTTRIGITRIPGLWRHWKKRKKRRRRGRRRK
jgi:hypothetical protein